MIWRVLILLPNHLVIRHLVLVAVVIGLAYAVPRCGTVRRLLRFAVGAIAISVFGVAIDYLLRDEPAVAARLLRYYWFRLGDAIVPLTAACLVALLVHHYWARRRSAAVLMGILSPAPVTVLTGQRFSNQTYAPRPLALEQAMPGNESVARKYRRYQEWQDLGRWAREHTEPGAIILAPRYQQALRWYSHRADVVSWKDIPQDAAAVVRWRARIDACYPPRVIWYGLAEHGETRLRELSRELGFQYVILDRTKSRRSLNFPRVYPPDGVDSIYVLHRVGDL